MKNTKNFNHRQRKRHRRKQEQLEQRTWTIVHDTHKLGPHHAIPNFLAVFPHTSLAPFFWRVFWGSKIGQHRCQNAPATQCAPKIRGALFSTAQNAAVHFGAIRTNLKFQIHRFSGFPEKERCVQEQETSKTSKRSRKTRRKKPRRSNPHKQQHNGERRGAMYCWAGADAQHA